MTQYHPGLAENIAPDGGPGSDIIVVRLQPLVCIMISIHVMSLPGPPSGGIFSAIPGWYNALGILDKSRGIKMSSP